METIYCTLCEKSFKGKFNIIFHLVNKHGVALRFFTANKKILFSTTGKTERPKISNIKTI